MIMASENMMISKIIIWLNFMLKIFAIFKDDEDCCCSEEYFELFSDIIELNTIV